jgi:hypothetical protein
LLLAFVAVFNLLNKLKNEGGHYQYQHDKHEHWYERKW